MIQTTSAISCGVRVLVPCDCVAHSAGSWTVGFRDSLSFDMLLRAEESLALRFRLIGAGGHRVSDAGVVGLVIDGADLVESGLDLAKGALDPTQALVETGHLVRRLIGVGAHHEDAFEADVGVDGSGVDGHRAVLHMQEAG